MNQNDINELVAERNAEYQDAWKLTGMLAKVVHVQLDQLLVEHPELWFNWIMELNKTVRLLGNPTKLDSWKDIQGYAQLSIDHLTQDTKGEPK